MVRNRLLQLAFALLSLAVSASAQTVVNVTLAVPTVGVNCGNIAEEDINGVVYPEGTEGQVCVHYNNNTVPLFFNMAPQPFAVGLGFYQITPDPSQIVFGPKVLVSGNIYSETDSFSYVKTYDDNGVHTDTWVGQIVRLQRSSKCGRFGRLICYTDISNNTQMTGSLVVQ